MNVSAFAQRILREGLQVRGLRVLQQGRETARHDFVDEIRWNQYSASKSITSLAVGIAQGEGLLSLSEKLVDAFAGDLPDPVPDPLRAATVRDLLTMCLGQDAAYLMGAQRVLLREADWVRYSLALPFSHMPGSQFLYNNVGPYLAGVLVQRRCGCSLVDYLTPRLFAPLDIPRPTWETDPQGRTFGAGGLFLAVSELARLGQLCLQEGQWQGRQLVPADFIRQAGAKQVENDAFGYGYLFWRGPHNSYRMDGMYGQFSIVFPDQQAVVALNSQELIDTQGILDAVFEELVPLM